jgi:hypothetical protein
MAVYRLHRKEWESGVMPRYPESTKKRKRASSGGGGGERKGIGSGMPVVVKNMKGSANGDKWWRELGIETGHGRPRGRRHSDDC